MRSQFGSRSGDSDQTGLTRSSESIINVVAVETSPVHGLRSDPASGVPPGALAC